MNPINEVTKTLAGYGFTPMPNQKFNSSTEFYFSLDPHESHIKKYVAIRKLTRSNSTSFRFGFSHKKIKPFYEEIFPNYDFGKNKATELQKWSRLSEQQTPIYKWRPGGFTKVQSCPRRRRLRRTDAVVNSGRTTDLIFYAACAFAGISNP